MSSHSDLPDFLRAINRRHVNTVDKFFRMFVGASSTLTDLDGSVFDLEIKVDRRVASDSLRQLAGNMARSWHRNPELEGCRECRVRILRQEGPTGFAIPAAEVGRAGDERTGSIVSEMLRQLDESGQLPAPLVSELRVRLTPREA